MQFSRLIFRASFILLAFIYALVMFNFIDPSFLRIDMNVSSDALIMTLVGSVFVYFFLKKPRR